MYRLLRTLFFLFPAERAHHLGFSLLRFAMAFPIVGQLLRAFYRVNEPYLQVNAFGLRFSNPVGLAAGFDKDAIGYNALGGLGFGAVEVGTLTAHAQTGNPQPRMFRLPQDRALINRMGFNNSGSKDAIPRLMTKRNVILGVNIGKSKITPKEDAAKDYATSTRRVGPHADYLVVNVSSPNTPGLRDLQAVDELEAIITAVQNASAEVCEIPPPLLVKIAPDLNDEDIDAIADLALKLKLAGIIATNTTISRTGLKTYKSEIEGIGAGGLSGAPLKERALKVLRRLHQRVGTQMVIIAAGGIETAEDAWTRICAGATLVQVYTGFVYGGPALPKQIAKGLASRLKAEGLDSIEQVIGRDA